MSACHPRGLPFLSQTEPRREVERSVRTAGASRIALATTGPNLQIGPIVLQAFGERLDAGTLARIVAGQDEAKVMRFGSEVVMEPHLAG